MGCGQTFDALAYSVYQSFLQLSTKSATKSMPTTWDFMQLDSDRQQIDFDPKRIRISPLIGLASIPAKLSGAYRIWEIGRHIDQQTKRPGWVACGALIAFCNELGVNERNWRRWVRQAVDSGLFRHDERKDRFYYVSPANAEFILGANPSRITANIDIVNLVKTSWKRYLWAAFNANLKAPMSQAVKEKLTGISERTQRYWQNGRKSKNGKARPITHSKQNYVDRRSDNVDVLLNVGLTAFEVYGRTKQRLPDQIFVPEKVAKLDKKRYRQPEDLSSIELAKIGDYSSRRSEVVRLFCSSYKSAKYALKKQSDIPAQDRPDEVFYPDDEHSNQWLILRDEVTYC